MKVLEPGSNLLSLEHQGRTRLYVVYVPKTGQAPYPVVLAFHGAGGTARTMLHHSRWSHHANLKGFVVVAPEGTPPKLDEKPTFRFNPQLWNLGIGSTASITGHADDVGFVRAILDILPSHIPIDQKRIYCTGFSNGAGLTFRIAIELEDRFAAISPIAGIPNFQAGATSRPIPMHYFIGSVDPLVPWSGGEVTSPWTQKTSTRPAVLESILRWTQESGFKLIQEPILTTSTVEEVLLGTSPPNIEVRYTKLIGLGHHWPGGKDVGVSEEILGPRIKTLDATERIWEFFQKYHL